GLYLDRNVWLVPEYGNDRLAIQMQNKTNRTSPARSTSSGWPTKESPTMTIIVTTIATNHQLVFLTSTLSDTGRINGSRSGRAARKRVALRDEFTMIATKKAIKTTVKHRKLITQAIAEPELPVIIQMVPFG